MTAPTRRRPARQAVRNSLVQAGLLTQDGAVAGVDPTGPDAALLADIARLADWNERIHAAWRQAKTAAERRRVFADSDGKDALERHIAATVPVTPAGMQAKLEAAMERMGGPDRPSPGCLWYLPWMALRDALAPGSPLWGAR